VQQFLAALLALMLSTTIAIAGPQRVEFETMFDMKVADAVTQIRALLGTH
jgi:hypothetical protein